MLIGAHRGAYKDESLDENSISAFKKAIEFKCDYVEFDVHKTNDGKFVIHHDQTINFPNKVSLKDSPWVDFLENYALPITQEHLPLLQEVITVCKNKIKMNVEIKDPDIGKEVVDILLASGLTSNDFFISSFHQSVIKDILGSYKDIYSGFLFLGNPWSIKNAKIASSLSCKAINPYYRFLSKKLVRYAVKNNLEINTWTVDGKALEKIMQIENISSIITNDCLLALEKRGKLIS